VLLYIGFHPWFLAQNPQPWVVSASKSKIFLPDLLLPFFHLLLLIPKKGHRNSNFSFPRRVIEAKKILKFSVASLPWNWP
jgi:hypothetical protein